MEQIERDFAGATRLAPVPAAPPERTARPKTAFGGLGRVLRRRGRIVPDRAAAETGLGRPDAGSLLAGNRAA